MKIFLTGSSGYVGSSLNKKLNFLGYNVIPINHKLFLESDRRILNKFFLESSFESNSIVIHVASSGVLANNTLEYDIRSNVIGTNNLIHEAFNFGLRKFIVIGTCFEYGLSGNSENTLSINADLKPFDNYSLSKVFQYQLCQSLAEKLSLDISYLRPFQIYGGAENEKRLFPSLISAIKNNKSFEVSAGSQVRDFVHIDALSDFIVDEINLLSGFQILNVASGIGTSVKDFVEFYWKKYKATSNLELGKLDQKQPLLKRLVGEPSKNENRRKIDPFYMYSHI